MKRHSIPSVLVFALLLTACTNRQQVIIISQPASWAQQVALAQAAADKISPNAQLAAVEGLVSGDDAPNSNAAGPMKMSYVFVDPTHADIVVDFLDTSPASTIHATKTGEHNDTFSAQEQRHLQEGLGGIKVSAFDAVHEVQLHRATIIGDAVLHIPPGAILRFDDKVPTDLGLHVSWDVVLTTRDRQFQVWVDPHTGKIRKQTSKAFP